MPKAKEKDDEQDKGVKDAPELVIVTDDERNLEVPPTGPQTDDEDLPRKTKQKDEEDDDEGGEEEEDQEEARLGQSEELEAEAEAKERAKASHKSRRQRQKEAEKRLRTERDFLERRNEQLEKRLMALEQRQDTGERAELERRIKATKLQIAKAEKVHADAIAAQKGEEATEALRIRDDLRSSLEDMEERQATFEKADKRPAPDPRMISNAREWMSRTTWYDPQLRDQDSKIVRALDVSVEQDGFDPTTPEYFEELDRRIAQTLPHRAEKRAKKRREVEVEDQDDEDEEDERPQRRQGKPANGSQRPTGGPRFRTGGAGRDLKPNEVYLSPERIAAMKEVGAWDDPKLRQKYLKKYQDWDRENGQSE